MKDQYPLLMHKIRFTVLIGLMILLVSCKASAPSAVPTVRSATTIPSTTVPTAAGKPTPE